MGIGGNREMSLAASAFFTLRANFRYVHRSSWYTPASIGIRHCHVRAISLTEMDYVWDTFDTYRLSKATLENFLRKKFGPYDFFISVKGSIYRFWIPRSLSEEERDELATLRY